MPDFCNFGLTTSTLNYPVLLPLVTARRAVCNGDKENSASHRPRDFCGGGCALSGAEAVFDLKRGVYDRDNRGNVRLVLCPCQPRRFASTNPVLVLEPSSTPPDELDSS